jgi:hypothetical protein
MKNFVSLWSGVIVAGRISTQGVACLLAFTWLNQTKPPVLLCLTIPEKQNKR